MPFKKGKSGNDAKKFKPGQSGNPEGRKGYERSLREHAMDLAGYTEEQLKGISNDNGLPFLKRKVADMLLQSDAEGVSIVSIMEQLDGKPAQAVKIDGNITHHVKVIERVKQQPKK